MSWTFFRLYLAFPTPRALLWKTCRAKQSYCNHEDVWKSLEVYKKNPKRNACHLFSNMVKDSCLFVTETNDKVKTNNVSKMRQKAKINVVNH